MLFPPTIAESLPPGLWVGAAGVFGAVVGSFLNVVIHRLPRGKSIAWPGSHCPGCERPIRAHENVPVLGYLALGGRCAGCKAPIAWRYPVVEAATAGMFMLVAHQLGPDWRAPALMLFVALGMVSFWIDWEEGVVFDAITVPGTLLGLGYAWATGQLVPALLAVGGALAGLGLLAGVGFVLYRQSAVGSGDFTLLAMLAAWLASPAAALAALALGVLTGALMGTGVLTASWLRAGRGTTLAIAGGTAAAAAAAIALALAALWPGAPLPVAGLGAMVSLLVGLMAGVLKERADGRESATAMPFGPALVLGAWASLFSGAGAALGGRLGGAWG